MVSSPQILHCVASNLVLASPQIVQHVTPNLDGGHPNSCTSTRRSYWVASNLALCQCVQHGSFSDPIRSLKTVAPSAASPQTLQPLERKRRLKPCNSEWSRHLKPCGRALVVVLSESVLVWICRHRPSYAMNRVLCHRRERTAKKRLTRHVEQNSRRLFTFAACCGRK